MKVIFLKNSSKRKNNRTRAGFFTQKGSLWPNYFAIVTLVYSSKLLDSTDHHFVCSGLHSFLKWGFSLKEGEDHLGYPKTINWEIYWFKSESTGKSDRFPWFWWVVSTEIYSEGFCRLKSPLILWRDKERRWFYPSPFSTISDYSMLGWRQQEPKRWYRDQQKLNHSQAKQIVGVRSETGLSWTQTNYPMHKTCIIRTIIHVFHSPEGYQIGLDRQWKRVGDDRD